jgi:hypothetical protein
MAILKLISQSNLTLIRQELVAMIRRKSKKIVHQNGK